MREADEHRRRQHALRLQRDAALLQRFVGFGVRALAHHVRQHGLVAPAHDGLDLALERAHDDVGRAQPGGVDVHVRIGMEAADDGGVPDDVVVEVGVHVQRYRHRRRRIDLAQAAQQVALGVFHALGHHGAVQVQQDGVEAAALDLVQHQPAQAFVCLGAGRPAGPGFGGDRQHDLGALAARHLDVAAQAAVGVLIGPDGAFAGQNFGIAAKRSSGVGTGEYVFVSCLIIANSQRMGRPVGCGLVARICGKASGRLAGVRASGGASVVRRSWAAEARRAAPGACVPRPAPGARPGRRSARRRFAGRWAGRPWYSRSSPRPPAARSCCRAA